MCEVRHRVARFTVLLNVDIMLIDYKIRLFAKTSRVNQRYIVQFVLLF
mgnify:CR=1 FL=1